MKAMDGALVDQFVSQFDHHDPRLGQDPTPVYERMLRECPVAHSDQHGGFWVVSNYQDVKFVLQNHELFTTEQTVTIPPGLGNQRPLLPLEVDPPEHIKYRALLAPVFSPKSVEALEPQIRATCDALIDSFIDAGRCEFVHDFAARMPTKIFVQMLGLPEERHEDFHNWKNTILHGHHNDPDGSRREAAGAEVTAFITDLIEHRKSHLESDIVSGLIQARVDGEGLSDQEILDITYLLFLAGLDTVTSALSLSFAYLAQNQVQRDRLVRAPVLIPSAVEELLRYESLIMVGRTVVRDVELGGNTLRVGDRVLCNTITADRDPAQFVDPDQVVFERTPNKHLAFSAGPHRCVGSHLARLELVVAFEHMHRRIPSYRLAEGATVDRHLTSVSGIDSLQLEWEPTA
jgi:hypothetical protein